jgi:hypothetical protein
LISSQAPGDLANKQCRRRTEVATDKSKLAAGAARLVKLIAELEEKYPRVSERRFRELLVETMMEAGNADPEIHEAVYWLAFQKLREEIEKEQKPRRPRRR